MGQRERDFLIENGFDDLVLNRSEIDNHNGQRGYKYVSDAIEMYVSSAQKEKAEAEPSTSTNKAMPEFPKYAEAEKEFLRWWHAKNSGDDTLSYRNMHEFYDIIVGNYRHS